MIDRRAFITILALGILLLPLAADAQQARKVYRIGYLWGGTVFLLDAFREGLRQHGYVEGQNIIIENRSAEGKNDRFPGLAAELVRLKVDIIVASSTPGALAAKNATKTIPIVMIGVGDPVGIGLVASLARPGGNMTGVTNIVVEIGGKMLELLKEAVPGVARVAVLSVPTNPVNRLQLKEIEGAARTLGIQLQSLEVRDPNEFEKAFSAMTRERAGALIVLPDALTFLHRIRIVDLAAKNRLPTMYGGKEFVDAGGLLSYGLSWPDMYRRAATYVDKILKGAKPVDLPVERPTRLELVINIKTAKALGLTIPQSMFIRADEIIQ